MLKLIAIEECGGISGVREEDAKWMVWEYLKQGDMVTLAKTPDGWWSIERMKGKEATEQEIINAATPIAIKMVDHFNTAYPPLAEYQLRQANRAKVNDGRGTPQVYPYHRAESDGSGDG